MPTKRKAAVKKEDEDSKKQQKQDGQKAVSHDIDVPVDEGFRGDGELSWKPNSNLSSTNSTQHQRKST